MICNINDIEKMCGGFTIEEYEVFERLEKLKGTSDILKSDDYKKARSIIKKKLPERLANEITGKL
jgi:hypothetical protein